MYLDFESPDNRIIKQRAKVQPEAVEKLIKWGLSIDEVRAIHSLMLDMQNIYTNPLSVAERISGLPFYESTITKFYLDEYDQNIYKDEIIVAPTIHSLDYKIPGQCIDAYCSLYFQIQLQDIGKNLINHTFARLELGLSPYYYGGGHFVLGVVPYGETVDKENIVFFDPTMGTIGTFSDNIHTNYSAVGSREIGKTTISRIAHIFDFSKIQIQNDVIVSGDINNTYILGLSSKTDSFQAPVYSFGFVSINNGPRNIFLLAGYNGFYNVYTLIDNTLYKFYTSKSKRDVDANEIEIGSILKELDRIRIKDLDFSNLPVYFAFENEDQVEFKSITYWGDDTLSERDVITGKPIGS